MGEKLFHSSRITYNALDELMTGINLQKADEEDDANDDDKVWIEPVD